MGGAGASGRIGKTPLMKAVASATDNVDNCLTSGSYWINENVEGCPISRAPLFVVEAKGRIWQYAFDSKSGYIRRHSVDAGASWEPWEWENPPVADGNEYRTTRRHEGKPVYAKEITAGNAPDSAVADYPHGLEGIIPVKWEATATDGDDVLALPYCNRFTVGVDSTNITLSTTEDYSGYTVKVTVWYCKEEDE